MKGMKALSLVLAVVLLGSLVPLGLAENMNATRKGDSSILPGVNTTNLTGEEFEAKLANLDLNDDERRALLYLFDRGGKASQAEVREAVGLPKTTAWRMFKRLERKGLVKILRGKKENWVELRF